jgi:VIT1/CCC1 family predicted Fe2+/Mn2+ transporter
VVAPLTPQFGQVSTRLSWLRAGVLGANDGIISIAGLVIGVAAATSDRAEIATAGIAGVLAGAVSMALGEYVSVSTQRDTERALIAREQHDLQETPEAERAELVEVLRERGFRHETAVAAVEDLTQGDPLHAHLALELGLDPGALANPVAAAAASGVAFTSGALLPLVAVVVPPSSLRIFAVAAVVLVALATTGLLSARLGGSPPGRAVRRLVVGGAAAMAVTYLAGTLVGVAV